MPDDFASGAETPSWRAFPRMSSAIAIAWDGLKDLPAEDGGTAMDRPSGFDKNFLRRLVMSFALLLAGSLSAQTFNAPSSTLNPAVAPKRPEQVFSKKIFWTEVGAYTVSNVLDGYTSVAHSPGYEEAGFPRGSSFLLGQHPSAGRYVATMGAMQIATAFAAYRLEHSERRFLRLVGHALMIQGIYAHTDGYIGNVVVQRDGSNLPPAPVASITSPAPAARQSALVRGPLNNPQ